MGSPFGRRSGTMVVAGGAYAPTVPAATGGSLMATRADNMTSSIASTRSELGDVWSGRVSLAALDFLILMAIAWYIYTRNIQGGG